MSDLDTRPSDPPVSGAGLESTNLGIAGKTARFFINSPLSPLLYMAMFLLGLLGLIITPRQEDPQIAVPMFDIFVSYPGTEAEQVASLAIQPLERIMSEIEGVKHVYSASMRGQGIVTVQFEVGEDMEESKVKVNNQLDSNMDKMPPGVMPPLVDSKGIDDVPVVNITLWSEKDYNGDGVPDIDDSQLRRLGLSVLQSLKEIPDTGEGFVVGGRSEQVTVEVFPERLAGFGIGLGQVAQTIQQANAEQQVGDVEAGGAQLAVVAGSFLKGVNDINELKVGSHNGVPVYVRDVADVRQGPEDAKQLVLYHTGVASEDPDRAKYGVPAVTIAVAKKKGTNGVTVANKILDRVDALKGRLIPNDIEVSITRNYGKTANDKVTALILKLFIATGFVFLLVWLAFKALKPAFVVLLVIPVVLLFTIFAAFMLGFTIDRVSLFALIFSIGILVDDAIVVVENIYRRWLEEGSTTMEIAVDAVREVGNPTILATFTVIGALLPMGFVTGMMGPYMLPIPILGSVAMLVSLFAAFMFTPWLAHHRWFRPTMRYLETAEKREHKEAAWLEKMYRRVLVPMIRDRRRARLFSLVMWGTFLLMCSLFYFKAVSVKMLPLDNKPEFAVVLDMPEGTALVDTANRANQVAEQMRKMPEVIAVQTYAGTARPFDFNGMVRHYYLRRDPWQAEVQVQLLDKGERHRSSHEIVVDARAKVTELLANSGARFAVVEMPPGPPVLQSVVAEVHHEDPLVRRQVARDLTEVFREAENLRDVDNYMRESYNYWHFDVDRDKAQRRGIDTASINQHLAMALGGHVLGDVKQRAGHEPVNIVIQIPLAERSQVSRLGDILVQGAEVAVPLRELGEFHRTKVEDIVYNKDLRPVEYVVADVGGRLAAPVYGMMQVEQLLAEKNYVAPDGVFLADSTYWTGPPPDDSRTGIEWAGEWTVTYETFRDMGIAFAAALVLIYVLVVWEFGNFRIPALIMAPIPLTLLGIIPAHALTFALGGGGEFTATSMIGWIALAGIIVRNSILLVDFSIHEVQKGTPVAEAVIGACKTRTRPIVITALALVAGSSVIYFDPIFQGMAISLASGVLVSTVLTLVVIPLGCVKAAKSLCEVAGVECPEDEGGPQQAPPAGGASDGVPLPLKVWGMVVGVVSFAFYAVRGIVLLLSQLWAKQKTKLSEPPPPTNPSPTKPPNAKMSAAADVTRVAAEKPVGNSSSVKAEQAVDAAPAAGHREKLTRGEGTKLKPTIRKKTATTKKAVVSAKKKTGKTAVTKASAPAEKRPGRAESAAQNSMAARPKAKPKSSAPAPKADVAKAAAPSTARSTIGSRPSTRTGKPVAKAAGSSTATKKTLRARPGGPRQDAEEPTADYASPEADAKPNSVQKKSGGRRGIRLKSLKDTGDDGLN